MPRHLAHDHERALATRVVATTAQLRKHVNRIEWAHRNVDGWRVNVKMVMPRAQHSWLVFVRAYVNTLKASLRARYAPKQ